MSSVQFVLFFARNPRPVFAKASTGFGYGPPKLSRRRKAHLHMSAPVKGFGCRPDE